MLRIVEFKCRDLVYIFAKGDSYVCQDIFDFRVYFHSLF